MKPGLQRKCPGCGAQMHRAKIVCGKCFARLPDDIRKECNAARDVMSRRAAVRRAVSFVTQQPELDL